MVALGRNLGRKHAMEMLLTGEPIDAPRAALLGLINRHVPPDELDGEVLQLAGLLASKSVHTIAVGKQAFYRQLEMPLADAYDFAAGVMVANMRARDAVEGVDAFVQKRAPRWQD